MNVCLSICAIRRASIVRCESAIPQLLKSRMEVRNGKLLASFKTNYRFFSFFVPPPIISLEGEGWIKKMKQIQNFNEQKAMQKCIDCSLLPPPSINGKISVHDASEGHPIISFEFVDNTVRLI